MPPLKLPFLKIYKARGKWRAYYRRDGKLIKIPGELGSQDWHQAYARIHAEFEAPPAPTPTLKPDSLAEVVKRYVASDRYRVLSPKTKLAYDLELDWLVSKWPAQLVGKIGRREAVAIRDKTAKELGPRKAMKRVLALKMIMQTAMDLGFAATDPTVGMPKPAGYQAEPWRAWTEEELTVFLAGARPVMRRAVMVLLSTGLRREDALKLTRAHIRDGKIYVVPGKTAKTQPDEVVIPILEALEAELAEPLAVESLHLMPNERGQQWYPSSVSHMVAKEARRLGIEQPAPLHGLRKNAVRRLLEAGCSAKEINAITGQSEAMIRHYGRGFSREKLAEAVVIKLRGR